MKVTKAQLKRIIKEELTNYYYVLDVNDGLPIADTGIIKKAYRSQAMANHPDRGGDAEKMKMINNAKDVLLNPDNKKKYDQALYKDTIDCKAKTKPGARFCPVTGVPLDDKFLAQFADLAGVTPDKGPEETGSYESTAALKEAILAGIKNRFSAALKAGDMEKAQAFLSIFNKASLANSLEDLQGYKNFTKASKAA